jgi:hypothetical protein
VLFKREKGKRLCLLVIVLAFVFDPFSLYKFDLLALFYKKRRVLYLFAKSVTSL